MRHSTERSQVAFVQFLPSGLTTYKALEQYHNQGSAIDAVKIQNSSMTTWIPAVILLQSHSPPFCIIQFLHILPEFGIVTTFSF